MISIIIPALNEEKNIGWVIDGIKKFSSSNTQIIVIDGGSQDKTIEIAKSKNIQVYKVEPRGKGRAMKFGAEKAKGEILVFIDGDGSYPSEAVPQLIKPILDEMEDIVYGSRFLAGSKKEMNTFRRLGNIFFSALGSILYKKKVDFLTGLFAIKKDKFLKLNLENDGFAIETEIFTKAVNNKFRLKEVPIEYKKNKNSKLNPLKDGLKILTTLLKNYAKT